MRQAESAAQLSRRKPAHLKHGNHMLIVRVHKAGQQHRISTLVAQSLGGHRILAVLLDISIVSQHISFLRTVSLFLHTRRLIVETVFLGGHHQGEQRIDQRTLSGGIGTGKQGIVSLGRHSEYLFVKRSPVVDFHILQPETRHFGTCIKQTQHTFPILA